MPPYLRTACRKFRNFLKAAFEARREGSAEHHSERITWRHLTEDHFPEHVRSHRMFVPEHVLTGRFLGFMTGFDSAKHPDHSGRRGDDASFRLSNALGVFDGVSIWFELRHDAGKYSQKLARLTAFQVAKEGPAIIVDALKYAAENNDKVGTSTACVVGLVGRKLIGINLGDSGLIVIRNEKIAYETTAQVQRTYHCPYQIGTNSRYTVADGDMLDFKVRDGDWVIMATNGLWDNLFKHEVLNTVNWYDEGDDADAQNIAEILVRIAVVRMRSDDIETPYMEKAKWAGRKHSGGKLDDITVFCSRIVDVKELINLN